MNSQSMSRSSESRSTGRTQTSLRNWTSPTLDPLHVSQPFLPPIRQLHPELPPPNLSHQYLTSGQTSTQMFSSHPPFALPAHSQQVSLGPRRASEAFDGTAEGDESEAAVSPPKKKRRRQALSCTECKRRKIKCDRAHPCAQCTRRGEQARCQWHIIEPVEKYVTRAEYEDLKGRFNELSEQVQRLQRHFPQMDGQQVIPPPGTTLEAVPSSSSGSGPIVYPALIPHASSNRPDASSQGLAIHPLVEAQAQPQPHQLRCPRPPRPISSSSSKHSGAGAPAAFARSLSPQARCLPPSSAATKHSLASIVLPSNTATHTAETRRSRMRPLVADSQRPRSLQMQIPAGQMAH